MPNFIIRVSGEITPEEERALRSAGIRRHDAGSAPDAYGGERDVVLSFVRTSTDSEREARAKVALTSSVAILTTLPPAPQRRISGRAGPAGEIPLFCKPDQ
jgi:hypothetical protein